MPESIPVVPAVCLAAAPRARTTAAVMVLLAFLLAFTYWALARTPLGPAVGFVPGSPAAAVLRALLGDYGPALAAVLAVAWVEGRGALPSFFKSLVRWRCAVQLYFLAILLPMFLVGTALTVGLFTDTVVPTTDPVNPLRVLAIFFVMVILDGPLGEEIGWRGLLLPRWLESMSPVRAGLLVGLVWWAWHIPIYLADGKANTAFDWAVFLVTTLSLSLIVSWLYLRAGGSVLIATLFHTSSNYAVFVFLRTFWQPSGEAQVLRLAYAAILIVAAALAATALWRRDPKHVEALVNQRGQSD